MAEAFDELAGLYFKEGSKAGGVYKKVCFVFVFVCKVGIRVLFFVPRRHFRPKRICFLPCWKGFEWHLPAPETCPQN